MKGERNKVLVAAEVDTEQKKVLLSLCEKLDRSVSWVIRDALNDYYKKLNFNNETVSA